MTPPPPDDVLSSHNSTTSPRAHFRDESEPERKEFTIRNMNLAKVGTKAEKNTSTAGYAEHRPMVDQSTGVDKQLMRRSSNKQRKRDKN